MCPKWATKKKKCGCGLYFHAALIGSSMKTTEECSACNPNLYKSDKEMKKQFRK